MVFACKWCFIYAYFSPDSDEITIKLEKAMEWIEDSYFSWMQWIEVKNVLMNLFIINTQLVFYVWIIVNLNSHCDGTHSLQQIHCWASDVYYIFPNVLMKKQTHLQIRQPESEHIFIFG